MIGKINHYKKLIRPFTLLVPMSGVMTGAALATSRVPDGKIILGMIAGALLNAASNTINQYFDITSDRINKPHRPLPSGKVTLKEAKFLGLLLYGLTLLFAFFVGTTFFFLISIGMVMTFFYSAPPLRTKRRPFLNNIAIAFPRGIGVIVAGWSIEKSIFSVLPWYVGLIFTLYLFGAVTTKDFSDIKGDRSSGIKTLPVLYGVKQSAKIISPFFYCPFLLIPLGVFSGLIKVATLPLTLLCLWGLYVSRLIVKYPAKRGLETNHISWKHMYFMLLAGHIGFILAYIVFP